MGTLVFSFTRMLSYVQYGGRVPKWLSQLLPVCPFIDLMRHILIACVSVLQFLVQALYDFTPQEPGELEFKRGDVITVTDRSDQHWWTGEIGTRRGLFPATYVAPYHT